MTSGWDVDISEEGAGKRTETSERRANAARTFGRGGADSAASRADPKTGDFDPERVEALRESAVEATALLADGFLSGSDDLGPGDADRIRAAAVRYLYRLLCLLYAESEEMDALARRVARDLDGAESDFRASETTLRDRLDDLFERVTSGRAAGRDGPLPAYDGALFETDPSADETAAFLQNHAVSDPALARAVDALARRDPPDTEDAEGAEFVDYAALSVAHLGRIYEALLDRELEVEAGEARLTTDAGGRAATGAYYTPEPLVEYAVERTLEPLLAAARAETDWTRPDAAERFARAVRDLDVVDPAMGCGRFLLATVEYLSEAIVDARRGRVERADPAVEGPNVGGEAGADASARHAARRRVAEECVYGVDADATAVEVARASLWLAAIPAGEAPALDHLKRGDALVGARVGDLADARAGASVDAPTATDSPTATDATDGKESAGGASAPAATEGAGSRPTRGPTPCEHLTAVANVRTAERLGVDVPDEAVRRLNRAASDPRSWRAIRTEGWFREVQSTADERDFFHWPLAFPGAFSGGEDERAAAGFDAVLGNPPYVRGRDLPADRKEYYRRAYRTAEGAADLYVPFVELAGELGGRVSLVVPNKWTTTAYGRPLRDLLLDDHRLREILDASDLDAFPDAEVYPVVVTFEAGTEAKTEGTGAETKAEGAADGDLRLRHPTGDRPLATAPTTAVPRSLVDRLGGRVVPLEMDLAFAAVVADALADCDRLGDHVEMSEAVHTGNVRGKLLADEPRDATCRKLVDGGSIDRYRLDWDGSWIRYDESLIERERGEYADLRTPALFEREKLLVRDVSDRPVAAYDDEEHYALNTLYSVRSRADSALSLRYLLGVFNSAFAARYFRQVYGGTGVAGGYLRFKPMFVADFPVPEPAPDAVDPAAVAAAAGVERPVPDQPELAVAALTERLRAATDERATLDTHALDYLGGDPAGPTLGERAVPAAGVRDSVLAETATDREGLRVGAVELDRGTRGLSVSATARYKPSEDDRETDSWGFAETDPVPALRLPGLDAATADLAEAFVPAAVERAGGFAGFRERAAKTISPLDRLRAVTLPDPEAAAADLRRYREIRARAAKLDERIAALEAALDGVVYRLYGLDEAEIAALDDAA